MNNDAPLAEQLLVWARKGARIKIEHAEHGRIACAIIHVISAKNDMVEYYDVEQRLHRITLSGITDTREDNGF